MLGRLGIGNQYQKQNPFNQIFMPIIQAAIALGVAWLTLRSVVFCLYMIGELQLIVFWLISFVFFRTNKTALAIGFGALGAYAWVSFFLWHTDYMTAFIEWTEFRVILSVVTGVIVPVVGYFLFKRFTTDLRWPNLVDSITAHRGQLREGPVADTIEQDEKEEGSKPFKF